MVLDEITGFIIVATSEPIKLGWVIFGVLLLLVLFLSFRHFFDIVIDLWKIPIAVVVDALDLLAYDKAYLDVVAAIIGFVLFWVFARRGSHLSKFFGFLVALESLIGFYLLPGYAFITNLLPLATILMFVLTWSK